MITKLLTKYNKPGPRYTSYPPATFFEESTDEEQYITQIVDSNSGKEEISLYIHIPFCAKLCHFCGCHTSPMQSDTFIRDYIRALKKEIVNVANLLEPSRPVTQIHWGGGTPNSIHFDYIREVMEHIYSLFECADYAEIAMECNPAHLTTKGVEDLALMGFNRLSLGVQDFDREVLRNINRDEPKEQIETLIAAMKEQNFRGTNLDLVYGLPGQSVESFTRAIRKAIACSPDRIVTFSYAHVPWVKKAQNILEKLGLPNSEKKLAMFEAAYNLLTESGYKSIGLDHYVKEDDELYLALQRHELHRNFQGYCSQKTTGQVYGVGCSAISQLDNGYIQNLKDPQKYIEAIDNSGCAFVRGYNITSEQQIVRAAINNIMCDGYLHFEKLAQEYEITVNTLKELLHFEPSTLDQFIDDGLLTFDGTAVTVTELGFFVVRNIAMAFDPMLSESERKYSKTI